MVTSTTEKASPELEQLIKETVGAMPQFDENDIADIFDEFFFDEAPLKVFMGTCHCSLNGEAPW